jgi:hypothetical protein
MFYYIKDIIFFRYLCTLFVSLAKVIPHEVQKKLNMGRL